MNGPTLLQHGDDQEKKRWPALQQHFPLYEEFWRLHIVPLRGADGCIRGDIDERLEIMAQEHYMCFISLGIALEGLADETHPERTFSSLQNAGNRAKQVVTKFNEIRAECLPANPDPVNAEAFADFCRNIALYRNHIHEDVMSMVEYQKRRYLPKSETLDQYKRWSRLRKANLADFTPVSDLLRERFEHLSTLLDQHWRIMLDRSQEVLTSPRYAQLLPPLPEAPIMQQIVLSSNIHLG